MLWLCAVVVLQGAKIKTQAQADPQFSIAGVRTWAWTPGGAGDVYMARSADDDAAVVKKRIDPLIVAAIAKEAGLAGLTPAASAETADINFHYYALATVGMDAQVIGQFLPAVTAWGVPPFLASTQSLEIITRGSLVLDVSSPKAGRVVWRGVAQTDLDYAPTDAKRNAIINDAAHELVKRLPLKNKK